ncbi:DNA sulfur modification protein DndD [Spirulina major CS-329]|uniref:DNA sulfur modification protein DndD n=1 Tax=Spirulina TaxID=1154 RepID=UPI00232F1D9A|nr:MULTISPECIES: DNA sulfur modification protein DndD [Spirulina]MDB9496904.1 DNA sulfur modification protein DndD [Spirulina subsalsa CS-330]MDB9502138.1 DNA sulfur modification protein DndD [Spirulina major CS-329]
MIFQSLTLQNFGPYAGRQTLNLTPDPDRPIILIGGMNGGGKTTIMDALRLVLYGQRAQCSNRGSLAYSDFLRQCIHHHTPPHAEVAIELVFEHALIGEPVHYRLRRAWEHHATPKETLSVFTTHLDTQTEIPDQALAKIWDERIEDLLPLGISNLFLFDGEQIKELAEQDTPPPDVITAIQSLLGLELPDRLGLDLKILRDRKQKAIAQQEEQDQLQHLETEIEQHQNAYQNAYQDLGNLQNQIDKAANELELATQMFNIRGGEITAQRAQLESQLHQLHHEAQHLQDRLRQLAAQTLPLGQIAPLLERARQQGHAELNAAQIAIAHQHINDHDRALLSFAQTQPIPPDALQRLSDFITTAQTQREGAIAQIQPYLNPNPQTLQRLDYLLTHHLPDAQNQVKTYCDRLELIALDIDTTQRQLAAAATPEEYAQLGATLSQAAAKHATLTATHHAQTQTVKHLRDTLNASKAQLLSYSNAIVARQNDQHILKSIDRVQNTLIEFRDRLKLRKVDHLESAVTECFRYLLRKTDFIHRVTVDTEKFTLTLYDTTGQTIPKKRLSAGEKQILATAFLWGLARVSGRHLPVAIDTPLGRLDSSHRHNLIERYFPVASHQVILLSTDTEIGAIEVAQLRQNQTITQEYRIDYDPTTRQSAIAPGYFDSTAAQDIQ